MNTQFEKKSKDWKHYLPSSKLVLIVLGIGLLALAIWGTRTGYQAYKKKKFVETTGLPTTTVIGDLVIKDSDGDGVYDWEEPLWGTDPKKADTDGNGVSDGVEIAERKAKLSGTDTENAPENLNETEKFARDFFVTINALSQTGALTDKSIENLAANLSEGLSTKEIPNAYEMKDLKVVPATKESLSSYQKKLSILVSKYQAKKVGTELDIITNSFSTEDASALASLNTIAEAYKQFAEDAAKLQVPVVLTEQHLAMINSFNKISVSLQGVAQVVDNPVVSMGGFITYTKESDAVAETIESIHSILQKNGILKE